MLEYDDALMQFVERAVQELQEKTAAIDALLRFEECDWEVDQEEGTITFAREDGMHASAPVQIIGTFNEDDGTWLWAWGHPSVEEDLRRDAEAVHQYGLERQILPFITRKLSCDQSDCWEFTAVATKFCNAQGAYRGPAGATYVFMTFGELAFSGRVAE